MVRGDGSENIAAQSPGSESADEDICIEKNPQPLIPETESEFITETGRDRKGFNGVIAGMKGP